MKKIILLGGGGFAREVLQTIEEINTHTENHIEPLGFVYDGGDRDRGKLVHKLPVLGEVSCLQTVDLNGILLVAAIGRSVWRKKVVEEAKKYGARFLNIQHPSSFVAKYTKMGEGFILQAQCIIQCDIEVGDFFVANDNVGIGHDTVIGNFVHANPKVDIAGDCRIGNDVFLGTKATILPCAIGDGAVIGACALVTKDVPPGMLAKGIPARYFNMNVKEY